MDTAELQRRIAETRARRIVLAQAAAAASVSLHAAQRRLRWMQMPVLRTVFRGSTGALGRSVHDAQSALDVARSALAGCVVDVDIPLDDEARAASTALQQSFDALRASAAIWSIEAATETDRAKHRTTAIAALTRRAVVFDRAGSRMIACGITAPRLPVAGGLIAIYPTFLLRGDEAGAFELIGLADCRFEYAHSDFIEQETVPPDAEIVGHTWAKANADGTRDNRFRDNRELPLVRYGHLEIGGPAGVPAVYQVSNWRNARAFAHAMADYQWALAGNARSSA